MNRLQCLALIALQYSLEAQISTLPTSMAFTMRQGLAYPNNSTRYPANQSLTLTGSSAWTAKVGGLLSTECGGPCLSLSPSSGNGSATVAVSYLARGAESLSAGKHSGTIMIGSQSVPVLLTVLPRQAYDTFVYDRGYPVNCRNSAAVYPHQDTCSSAAEMPGAAVMNIVGPGSSTRDQNFGGIVSRITPAGYVHEYSTVTPFSATAKYLMTSTDNGKTVIFDRAARSIAYTPGGISFNSAAWDPINEEIIWYLDGSQIKFRNVRTEETVIAADYASPSASRPALPQLSTGGTADVTDDRWWVFTSGTNLCAVNLANLTPATQEGQTRCASLARYGITYLDFAQITQVDAESKKRYVTVMAQPRNELFSVGSGGLTYEHPIPTGPSDVWASAHATVGQDSEGRQIMFWQYSEIYGSKSYLATLYLNKGTQMTRPAEEGGGLRFLYPSDPKNSATDAHFGCTWRGVCVFTPYGSSGGLRATNITSIVSGANCGITTRTAHGLSASTKVLIGGVQGVTGINGIADITVTGANSFSLNNRACSGNYVSGSGNVAANVKTSPDSPNRDEVVLVRPGHEVRRIAIHGTKPWDNGYNMLGYFNTPRSSISRDGRYIAFGSNAGLPEVSSVWVAETGVSADLRIKSSVTAVSTTSAQLSYSVPPLESSASIVVTSWSDLSTNLAASIIDGQTTISRQVLIGGLFPATKYYYRISTGKFSFTGSFSTIAPIQRLRP